jgi:hypothetical protein
MKNPDAMERELEQALSNFRHSVHAWSEAELSRPRTMTAEHARTWRLAVAWALGCVLAAGSLAGGLYDRHLHQVQARLAAEYQAQQRAAEQRAQAAARQNDEKLFAAVDNDVSRAVPSAMEPLAQLMEDSSSQ